jgi:hypothetical protein
LTVSYLVTVAGINVVLQGLEHAIIKIDKILLQARLMNFIGSIFGVEISEPTKADIQAGKEIISEAKDLLQREKKSGVSFHELAPLKEFKDEKDRMVASVGSGDAVPWGIFNRLNFKFLGGDLEDSEFVCVVCRRTLNGKSTMEQHLAGKDHKLVDNFVRDQIGWTLACNVCNVPVPKGCERQHLEGHYHTASLIWLAQKGVTGPQGWPTFPPLTHQVQRGHQIWPRMGSSEENDESEILMGTETYEEHTELTTLGKVVTGVTVSVIIVVTLMFVWSRWKPQEEVPEANNAKKKFAKQYRKALAMVRLYSGDDMDDYDEREEEWERKFQEREYALSLEERERRQKEWDDAFAEWWDNVTEDMSAAPSLNFVAKNYPNTSTFQDRARRTYAGTIAEAELKKRIPAMQRHREWRATLRPVKCVKECVHVNTCPKQLPISAWHSCNKVCGGHNCTHWAGCVPEAFGEEVTFALFCAWVVAGFANQIGRKMADDLSKPVSAGFKPVDKEKKENCRDTRAKKKKDKKAEKKEEKKEEKKISGNTEASQNRKCWAPLWDKPCSCDLNNKSVKGKHNKEYVKGVAANTMCTHNVCKSNYAKGQPPRAGCYFKHQVLRQKKVEGSESKVELNEPESLGGQNQVGLDVVTKAVSAVGIMNVGGKEWANCFKACDRIYFGKHFDGYTDDQEVMFVFGKVKIKFPAMTPFHGGSLLKDKVKLVGRDNLAEIWTYECKEILTGEIPNLKISKSVPQLQTNLMLYSQFSVNCRKAHVENGKMTSRDSKENDQGICQSIRYSIPTTRGNCFSPVVTREGPMVVVAVHTGGDPSGGASANQGVTAATFQ